MTDLATLHFAGLSRAYITRRVVGYLVRLDQRRFLPPGVNRRRRYSYSRHGETDNRRRNEILVLIWATVARSGTVTLKPENLDRRAPVFSFLPVDGCYRNGWLNFEKSGTLFTCGTNKWRFWSCLVGAIVHCGSCLRAWFPTRDKFDETDGLVKIREASDASGRLIVWRRGDARLSTGVCIIVPVMSGVACRDVFVHKAATAYAGAAAALRRQCANGSKRADIAAQLSCKPRRPADLKASIDVLAWCCCSIVVASSVWSVGARWHHAPRLRWWRLSFIWATRFWTTPSERIWSPARENQQFENPDNVCSAGDCRNRWTLTTINIIDSYTRFNTDIIS